MRDATPDYQKHLQDNLSAFCFGDTYTRGTLNYKTREMITMAVIGAMGGAEPQYKSHVAGTLNSGATNEEVIGVITTMNPYIGFPRTLNALRIANEVFNERKNKCRILFIVRSEKAKKLLLLTPNLISLYFKNSDAILTKIAEPFHKTSSSTLKTEQ